MPLWWQARIAGFMAGMWMGRAVQLERERLRRRREIRDLERSFAEPVPAEDGAA